MKEPQKCAAFLWLFWLGVSERGGAGSTGLDGSTGAVRRIKVWKRRGVQKVAMPESLLVAGFPRIVSLPLEGKVPRRGG